MVSDNNTALCSMSMRRWDSLQPLCMGVPEYCGNWESGRRWDEVGISSSLFLYNCGVGMRMFVRALLGIGIGIIY